MSKHIDHLLSNVRKSVHSSLTQPSLSQYHFGIGRRRGTPTGLSFRKYPSRSQHPESSGAWGLANGQQNASGPAPQNSKAAVIHQMQTNKQTPPLLSLVIGDICGTCWDVVMGRCRLHRQEVLSAVDSSSQAAD